MPPPPGSCNTPHHHILFHKEKLAIHLCRWHIVSSLRGIVDLSRDDLIAARLEGSGVAMHRHSTALIIRGIVRRAGIVNFAIENNKKVHRSFIRHSSANFSDRDDVAKSSNACHRGSVGRNRRSLVFFAFPEL